MELDNIKSKLLEINQRTDYSKYEDMRRFLVDNGIEVIRAGGAKLGNCYHAEYFEVRVAEEIDGDFMKFLRKIGLLGYGQEFIVEKPFYQDGKFLYRAASRADSSD